ncbi:MAG: LLM class flavin-dependent oxidoreductase [Myxococcales bacterium]|nr:LLM class flavin-dependent oxidoreductase [Myxococcales bacterium]
MEKKQLKAVFIGEESLVIQCAKIWQERNHEILAVVSDTPQIVSWARQEAIPVIPLRNALAESLADIEPDHIFSIGNLAILPDQLVAKARRSAINFHDGPLPEYAGMYSPVWALLNGEREYGVSFHEIAGGINEGDVLVERRFEIRDDETSITLNAKNFEAAIDAFGELVEQLESDEPNRLPQDLSARKYFGRYHRPPDLCAVDLDAPAEQAARLVRALDFGPYANPFGAAKLIHQGRAIVLGAAEILTTEASSPPGTLLGLEGDALSFQASDGVIAFRGLRTLGGTELSAAEAIGHLGLRVGDLCIGPTAAQRARWSELGEPTARAEERWVEALSSLDGVEFPFGTVHEEDLSHSPRARLTVAAPRDGDDNSAPDNLLSALALFLSRLSRQEGFDVALLDPGVASTAADAHALFRTEVPWRVPAFHAEVSFREASAQLFGTLERCRKRGPLLNEVALRHRILDSGLAIENRVLLPVLIGHVDDVTSFEAPRGAWLAFLIDRSAETVTIDFDERSLSFAEADRVAAFLDRWLRAVAEAPDAPFQEIQLLSDTEHNRVIREWNATDRDYPSDQTIVQLFESQVERTPDAEAVVCEGKSYTYRELNARANQLAAHLRDLGVGPDVMVGVHVVRSLDMIVSVYGIMKAGGAYVPLDPSYPRDRIAFMIEDSQVPVVLTQGAIAHQVAGGSAKCISVDTDWDEISAHSKDNVSGGAKPHNLAYVIYTSGSTGKPKGVMVEHRNVVNFFAGMDDDIAHDPPGVWLAVTSLSFDISVLELHWTLCRGFKVLLHVDSDKASAGLRGAGGSGSGKQVGFGMFFWGNDEGPGSGKYELMIEAAKFADANDFAFVSTPERHFHAFGGPFPNPSVVGAALAMVTKNVEIRSGSVVLPLHHPIRVAEEWAVVDNLSDGRVALSIAAGWQPNDFVIRPGAFKNAKARMFEDIEVLRRLWRGESVEFENPLGDNVPTRTLPRPVQPELPLWVTIAGNVKTYEMAGRAGANVLTHLLGQTVEEVAEKIQVYRNARAAAGLDPATGKVTLMLHTLVGEDDNAVRNMVRQPMKDYLKSSVGLVKGFAWSFSAFRRPEGVSRTDDVSLDHLTEEEMDALIEHAFERYYETSGLFGTVERCVQMVHRVREAGIDEIACLIDYGVPTADMYPRLPLIAEVMRKANAAASAAPHADHGLAELVARHGVTHFQCTPSMAKMMTMHDDMRDALAKIGHIMVGGEAFPVSLAHALDDIATGTVTNMYGPTETTIWSSTQRVAGKPGAVHVGKPIANTQFYIVDANLQPTPLGVPGELLIGGDGVTRGYYKRPELTEERFVSLKFTDADRQRAYRTGDLARYLDDGTVDLLGRMDFQVKIRGHRIELGEIETALGQQPGVRECVVTAQPDSGGDLRLVGYVVPDGEGPDDAALREALRARLPEYMVPSVFAQVPSFPLTPNGKIDRKALKPTKQRVKVGDKPAERPSGELESSIAEVWQRVLQISDVGRDHNFFDIGGHSLLAVQVHRDLQQSLEQPVSLTDLYRFPTIASLARYLAGEGPARAIGQATDRGARRRQAMARRRKVRGG